MANWNTALDRAGAWFLHSGIQEPGGGVARYYRSDLRKNARISTEITGYAVSFLIYLHECTETPEYLAAAVRAARFLCRQMWDGRLGLFAFEHSSNGSQPDALAYFFDSGIIARGLLAVWRTTMDQEFFDIAVATGQGMLAHFNGPQAIHPILELPDRRPLGYQAKWSAAPGCYQLKSAMAWYELFEETGNAEFGEAYEAALDRSLKTHEQFLPGDESVEKVMDRLHAYLYFLEGLLPCAQRKDCAIALRTGIEKVARYIREIAPVFVRSDVYGQLLRVRLFAADTGVVPLDAKAALDEAEDAANFQFRSEDPRFNGGFGFGTKGGEPLPFVNPVSTVFCAQAIEMWQQHQANELATDHKALI